MPWSAGDAKKHKKGLTSAQAKKWAEIANSVYRDCMSTKDNDKFCSGKAIRLANYLSTQETKRKY
ncbi:MAG: hypothetical protein FJ150_02755 [Euryarchaeota archaeon]|nr:hypothetical protein [Euryarchaeota archaeon]